MKQKYCLRCRYFRRMWNDLGETVVAQLLLLLWLYSPLLGLGRFFSFFILYTFGRSPWTGDQSVARPLPTHKTQISIPWVGFEPTNTAFDPAKAVHSVSRAATVIGVVGQLTRYKYRSRRGWLTKIGQYLIF
jgi:hypothetical protein